MAEMRDFGPMPLSPRGGPHDFSYPGPGQSSAGPTPSQTVGPFFAYGLTPGAYGYPLPEIHGNDLTGPETAGERISIEGQVFDAQGAPVHDAMVEILQADAAGQYVERPRNDGFTGYGRCGTGSQGPQGDTRFTFRTVRPGPTQAGAAPFIALILTMRGLLNHCVTRLYFPEDGPEESHAGDPVLSQVPEERRQTLIAAAIAPGRYRFDIYMQGPRETVFFDV